MNIVKLEFIVIPVMEISILHITSKNAAAIVT